MSRLLAQSGGATYAGAGVSIEAGDEAVERIKAVVASTSRAEVLGGIGGFGGLFALDTSKYRSPVLVASADGVGTKLDVARQLGRYDTVGIDLVAMLVDDLACVGAEPLFLLDYVAVGKLEPARLEELVTGIARGCVLANVALLGGETAEHGGVMAPDDLDVAGFTVGVVERGTELGAQRVRVGDVLVGFASPGLRSNGYTLARQVLVTGAESLHAPAWDGAATTLGDELLVPSVIYVPTVLALRQELGTRARTSPAAASSATSPGSFRAIWTPSFRWTASRHPRSSSRSSAAARSTPRKWCGSSTAAWAWSWR